MNMKIKVKRLRFTHLGLGNGIIYAESFAIDVDLKQNTLLVY